MHNTGKSPFVIQFQESREISSILKQQLLEWSSRFSSCCFLDNHQYPSDYQSAECLFGADAIDSFTLFHLDQVDDLDLFLKRHRGKWIFGNISYNVSPVLHQQVLPVSHPDPIQFPVLYFFVPRYCYHSINGKTAFFVQDHSMPAKQVWNQIIETKLKKDVSTGSIFMQPVMQKSHYLEAIEKIRKHILRGDCYEINFCQEFFAKDVNLSPIALYQSLLKASPNPFACYYRVQDAHLMCASPERFLMKKGEMVYSQPIKGTAPRNPENEREDESIRMALGQNSKERSENVMIVDLVRNDLSKICRRGTVEVAELFGLYSYPQVHQMMSTIQGKLLPNLRFWDILKACFPMGSMTGAPKHKVMELINTYEYSSRGLYSGSVGYFTPEGDFDFNVVIRSLQYNSQSKYLNYHVGGGITWYSEAEKEYEECLLKAKALRSILESG